jgi:hypothetical protein
LRRRKTERRSFIAQLVLNAARLDIAESQQGNALFGLGTRSMGTAIGNAWPGQTGGIKSIIHFPL